jgi:Flp pilus assembly protein TadD
MSKYFLLAFLLGFAMLAQAQEISPEERAFLDEQLFIPIEKVQFEISFNTSDLRSKSIELPSLANIEKLKKKLKGKPEDAPILADIAEQYRQMHYPQEQEAYLLKAVQARKEQIAANPKDYDAHLGLAGNYLALRQPRQALQVYQLAETNFPKNEKTYIGLAAVSLTTGDAQGYGEACEKIIQMQPASLEGHFGKIFVHLFQKLQESGQGAALPLEEVYNKAYFDTLLKRFPKNKEIPLMRDLMRVMAVFFSAAEENNFQTQNAIRLNDTNKKEVQALIAALLQYDKKGHKNKPLLYRMLAALYFLENNYALSKEASEKALLANPYLMVVYDNALLMSTFHKKYDDALSLVNRRSSIKGANTLNDQLVRAWIYTEAARYEEAKEMLLRIEQAQQGALLVPKLALVHIALRERKFIQAKDWLLKAEAAGQQDFDYWGLKTFYELYRGNREQARIYLEKALALSPESQSMNRLRERFFQP